MSPLAERKGVREGMRSADISVLRERGEEEKGGVAGWVGEGEEGGKGEGGGDVTSPWCFCPILGVLVAEREGSERKKLEPDLGLLCAPSTGLASV
jgi:hypothetical protein